MADARTGRYVETTPIARLAYDVRENGYLMQAQKGRPAHTNEYILIDCALAIIELADRVAKLTEIAAKLVPDRTKTIDQGRDLMGQVLDIDKRLKRVEGTVKAFMIDQ